MLYRLETLQMSYRFDIAYFAAYFDWNGEIVGFFFENPVFASLYFLFSPQFLS